MFSQCALSYRQVGREYVLSLWPVKLGRDFTAIKNVTVSSTAYIAVDSPRWENRIIPPRAKELPLPGNGKRLSCIKRLSSEAVRSYLQSSHAQSVIDIFMYFPYEEDTDEEFVERCFLTTVGGSEQALKKYGGYWLHVHDGDLARFITGTRQTTLTLFKTCIAALGESISTDSLRNCWNALISKSTRGLVVSAYHNTLFFRHVPRKLIDRAEFTIFFRWGASRIYRAGRYGANPRLPDASGILEL
jgi:hypothetical protein